MNREILFRGKCVDNGKWVYGYYMLWDKSTYIIVDKQFYEVNPETVGQDTGLYDKNGTKIFEGDKAYLDDEIVTIVLDEQDAMFCIEEGDNRHQHFGYINSHWLEIIGNIHDKGESK